MKVSDKNPCESCLALYEQIAELQATIEELLRELDHSDHDAEWDNDWPY